MIWRIPKVGDRMVINPEFVKTTSRGSWAQKEKQIGILTVTKVEETDNDRLIIFFDKTSSTVVSKFDGAINHSWSYWQNVQVYLFADEDKKEVIPKNKLSTYFTKLFEEEE